MNKLMWIKDLLNKENIKIPNEVKDLIEDGMQHKSPFFFLDMDDGRDEMASMHQQFPGRRVIALARRGDYDGVVCVVLVDWVFERGQVIVVHDDAIPGVEIDEEYPSLAVWAKAAHEEIDERVRMG